MKKALQTVFILSLILSSCKKDDPAQEKETLPGSHFTYIKVGHRWVYDFKMNNTVYDSLVREIQSVNNDGVYSGFTQDSEHTLQEYYFILDSQLMHYTEGQDKSKAVVLNKENLHKGEEWIKMSGNDSLLMSVESQDAEVSTPQGSFRCVELKEKNLKTQFITTYRLHKDYGMISMNMTYNGQKVEYLLRHKNF